MDTPEIPGTALLLKPMTAGIIIAMKKEFQQMGTLPEDIHPVLCGIGKVNAAAATQSLIDSCHPDCIISAGVAGGLKECLHQGDVVIGENVAYHDVWCGEGNRYGQVQGLPGFFTSDPSLARMASDTECVSDGRQIFSGLVCTGDKFSDDGEVLANINTHFPDALAVDMESAAVAQVCLLNKIPFLCFRIISNLSFSAESCSQYDRFWATEAEASFAAFRSFVRKLTKR